ncbi:MAG: CRISPR-associated endonuclease Cas2 [Chloroflexota bacterium]
MAQPRGAGTRCLVVYDITEDRVRVKVADACLDYGLQRIQYSAFAGILSRNRQGELLQRIRKLVGRTPAIVHIVPICEKDWAAMASFVITQGEDAPARRRRPKLAAPAQEPSAPLTAVDTSGPG